MNTQALIQLLMVWGALAVVTVGIGVTFGWWIGCAAGAACWLLMPYHPKG